MPTDRKQQFIQALMPYARDFEKRTGIPAAYVLAMAANETGWNADNPVLFGIKGKSPSGKGATFQTWEVEGGKRVDQPAQFATYDSPAEAFQHLAQNMLSARYKDAPKDSPLAFASYLQRKGWATDPQYAQKIARLAGEIGNQPTGGTGMPDTGQEPQGRLKTDREVALEDLQARVDELRQELDKPGQGLRAQRAAAAAEYGRALAAYEASKNQPDPDNPWLKLPADTDAFETAQVAKQQIELLDKQITARETELRQLQGAYNTARRQPDKTAEQAKKEQSDAAEDYLKHVETFLARGLALGQFSESRADNLWKKAFDLSNQGMAGISQGYDLFLRGLPFAGDRRMADALWGIVEGWNQFGAKMPKVSLPVYDFNPQQALAPYMPKPEQVQQAWQQAMTAPSWRPSDEEMQTLWQRGLGQMQAPVDPMAQGQMWQQAMAGAGRDASMAGAPTATPPATATYGEGPAAGYGQQQPWQQGLSTPTPSQADLEGAYRERQPWQAGVSAPGPSLINARGGRFDEGATPNLEDDEIMGVIGQQLGMTPQEAREYLRQLGD